MLIHRFAFIPYAVVRFYNTGGYLPKDHSKLPSRILERDVDIMTLEAGKFATRVRGDPQEQIWCVGGSAMSKFKYYPSQISCKNMGIDDTGRVNWMCYPAGLDKRVKISTSTVSFEGWDRPGDEYVRAGSAVVRYHLDWVNGPPPDYSNIYIYVGVVSGIILCIYLLNPHDQPKIQADIHKQPEQPKIYVHRVEQPDIHIHETQRQPDVHIYEQPKVYVHHETTQSASHIRKSPSQPKTYVHEEPPKDIERNDSKIFFAKSTTSE